MAYERLHASSVVAYLDGKGLLGGGKGPSEWVGEEIGTGNMNFVFLVRQREGGDQRSSLVVKQVRIGSFP